MTDQTGSADQTSSTRGPVPDYDLPEALTLQDPAQYGALFEETRQAIVSLLSERAATISELAVTLGKPKGTVGHHVQVLADAGLVHVVRTEKVRALEAKYWGRTARIFFYDNLQLGDAQRLLERAAADVGRAETLAVGDRGVIDVNRRDVRVPAERAVDFQRRLASLLTEFAEEPRTGDTTYAIVFGIFPSSLATLPEPGGAQP